MATGQPVLGAASLGLVYCFRFCCRRTIDTQPLPSVSIVAHALCFTIGAFFAVKTADVEPHTLNADQVFASHPAK